MVAAVGIEALSKMREETEWYAFGDLWSDPAEVFAQAKMLSDATKTSALEATLRALRGGEVEEVLDGVTDAVIEASPPLGLLYASVPRDGTAITETVVLFRMSCAESLWDFADFETVAGDARVQNIAVMITCFGPIYHSDNAHEILAKPVIQGFLTWTRRRLRDLERIDPEGFVAFLNADGEHAALARRMLEVERADMPPPVVGRPTAEAMEEVARKAEIVRASSEIVAGVEGGERHKDIAATVATVSAVATPAVNVGNAPPCPATPSRWPALALSVAIVALVTSALCVALRSDRSRSAGSVDHAEGGRAASPAELVAHAPALDANALWAAMPDRDDCSVAVDASGIESIDARLILAAVVPRSRRGRSRVTRTGQGMWPTYTIVGCRGVIAQAARDGRLVLTSRQPLGAGRALAIITTRTQAAGGDDEGSGFLAIVNVRAGRLRVDGIAAWAGQAHQYPEGAAQAIRVEGAPGLLLRHIEAGTNDGSRMSATVMALSDGHLAAVGGFTLEDLYDASCMPGSVAIWHQTLRRTVAVDEAGLLVHTVRRWERGQCVEGAGSLPPLVPVERVTDTRIAPTREALDALERESVPDPPLPDVWRALRSRQSARACGAGTSVALGDVTPTRQHSHARLRRTAPLAERVWPRSSHPARERHENDDQALLAEQVLANAGRSA